MALFPQKIQPTMPKNKRPVPRKPDAPVEQDDESLAQALASLAFDLSRQQAGPAAALLALESELDKQVRNALRKKKDEVLYGAIELARFEDSLAYQRLREHIEEAAATVLLRREGAPAMEINAFAVPLFIHSAGGLKEAEGFQDGAAFDALVASFQQAGLESPKAKVVMLSHAYDLDEIDAVTYSHLNDMLRDAAASMTDKKLVANPALERSIRGWRAAAFGPGDKAVELRFLLGFALKRADDPFYAVPKGEAEADAYFEARMRRYQAWTADAAPLVARCLSATPAALEVHFLYQDLFYGAKEQGMAELAMLGLMSEVNAALDSAALAPAQVRAEVGAAADGDELVLQVKLSGPDGAPLATLSKPLDVAADLHGEEEDLCDALATLGVDARPAPR
jgi:hypothetical protein